MANKYKSHSKDAQRRRRKYRSCTSKKRFANEKEARRQKNMDVYQCRYCDGWHRTGKFKNFVRSLSR